MGFRRRFKQPQKSPRTHDVLVCVGAVPDRVETGFGHHKAGGGARHEWRDCRTPCAGLPREAGRGDRAAVRKRRSPVEHGYVRVEKCRPSSPSWPSTPGRLRLSGIAQGRRGSIFRGGPGERRRHSRHGALPACGNRSGALRMGRCRNLGGALALKACGLGRERAGRRRHHSGWDRQYRFCRSGRRCALWRR